jgi:hypothetical protein
MRLFAGVVLGGLLAGCSAFEEKCADAEAGDCSNVQQSDRDRYDRMQRREVRMDRPAPAPIPDPPSRN